MLDLNKSLEVFNPDVLDDTPVHVIGCGAIGSHVAECLARLGVNNIHLYDDDVVATHNIANQMFTFADVGKNKTTCVAEMITAISPGCEVTIHNRRVTPEDRFRGYVFLCVDSIEPRRFVTETNANNYKCAAIFDFRMGLFSGQFYCAHTEERKRMLLKTMNFTDEEADAGTPKSACNFELSVVYTIKVLVGVGMSVVVNCLNNAESVPFTTIIDLNNTEHMVTQM